MLTIMENNFLFYFGCFYGNALSDLSVLHFRHSRDHYPAAKEKRNVRDFYKITLVVRGKATLYCNDAEFQLTPGKLFLTHPDDRTSYGISSDFLEIYDVIIKRFVPVIQPEKQTGLFRIFSPDFVPEPDSAHITPLPAGREIPQIIRLMYLECRKDSGGDGEMLQLLQQLFFRYLERLGTRNAPIRRAGDMTALVDRQIEDSYQTGLDFQKLAVRAGVSPEHLGRVYRKNTGHSITGALKQYRLQKAAELLKSSTAGIPAIAIQSGFQDSSLFFRAFKKQFGCSPAEFRRLHGSK